MTDVQQWINGRRNIQAKAAEGPWELGHGGLDFSGLPDAIVCGEDDPIIYPQDERGGGSWGAVADAEAIVDAHNTLPRALSAIEEVLDLHRKAPVLNKVIDDDCHSIEDYGVESGGEYLCSHPSHVTEWTCHECFELNGDDDEFPEWPCETYKAIEGAISDE